MDRLWAPWRSAYVVGEAKAPEPGCIFCTKPAKGEERFAEELILGTAEHAFVILNKYPYNNGHIMVVPREHVASPVDLPSEAHAGLWDLVRISLEILKKAMGPDGINLGMNLGQAAGAGIAEHCHVHLVPRWNGDTNFMPVVGQAKVISQQLETTFRTLLPHFVGVPGFRPAQQVAAEGGQP